MALRLAIRLLLTTTMVRRGSGVRVPSSALPGCFICRFSVDRCFAAEVFYAPTSPPPLEVIPKSSPPTAPTSAASAGGNSSACSTTTCFIASEHAGHRLASNWSKAVSSRTRPSPRAFSKAEIFVQRNHDARYDC